MSLKSNKSKAGDKKREREKSAGHCVWTLIRQFVFVQKCVLTIRTSLNSTKKERKVGQRENNTAWEIKNWRDAAGQRERQQETCVRLSQLVVWLFSFHWKDTKQEADTAVLRHQCHLHRPAGTRLSPQRRKPQYHPPTVYSIRTMLSLAREEWDSEFVSFPKHFLPWRSKSKEVGLLMSCLVFTQFL